MKEINISGELRFQLTERKDEEQPISRQTDVRVELGWHPPEELISMINATVNSLLGKVEG